MIIVSITAFRRRHSAGRPAPGISTLPCSPSGTTPPASSALAAGPRSTRRSPSSALPSRSLRAPLTAFSLHVGSSRDPFSGLVCVWGGARRQVALATTRRMLEVSLPRGYWC